MSQEFISSKNDIHASIDSKDDSVKTSPGRTVSHFISGKGHLLNSLTLTILILIGMVITFSILSPHFLSKANIYNIFEQNVVFGIMACGMAFMIITGGFDLSVGSTAALTGRTKSPGLNSKSFGDVESITGLFKNYQQISTDQRTKTAAISPTDGRQAEN